MATNWDIEMREQFERLQRELTQVIQRELRDFRKEWRQKSEDTDKVLANHGSRIVVLERVTGVSPE